jgi:hypothetical protein
MDALVVVDRCCAALDTRQMSAAAKNAKRPRSDAADRTVTAYALLGALQYAPAQRVPRKKAGLPTLDSTQPPLAPLPLLLPAALHSAPALPATWGTAEALVASVTAPPADDGPASAVRPDGALLQELRDWVGDACDAIEGDAWSAWRHRRADVAAVIALVAPSDAAAVLLERRAERDVTTLAAIAARAQERLTTLVDPAVVRLSGRT